MKRLVEKIDITPEWRGLVPSIVYGLTENKNENNVWSDSVMQLATIADEFTRLVKVGKITQKDTTINLSRIKKEKQNES